MVAVLGHNSTNFPVLTKKQSPDYRCFFGVDHGRPPSSAPKTKTFPVASSFESESNKLSWLAADLTSQIILILRISTDALVGTIADQARRSGYTARCAICCGTVIPHASLCDLFSGFSHSFPISMIEAALRTTPVPTSRLPCAFPSGPSRTTFAAINMTAVAGPADRELFLTSRAITGPPSLYSYRPNTFCPHKKVDRCALCAILCSDGSKLDQSTRGAGPLNQAPRSFHLSCQYYLSLFFDSRDGIHGRGI